MTAILMFSFYLGKFMFAFVHTPLNLRFTMKSENNFLGTA